MDRPFEVRAKCPACEAVFPVEVKSGITLRASTAKIARQMISGLERRSAFTYVFDKALGDEGKGDIPDDLICPNCHAVHQRTRLEYRVYEAANDTTE